MGVWGFTQKEVLAHLGFPLVLLFCWMEFSFRSEGLYLMNGGRHRHIGFWAGGGFYQGTFLNLQDSCNTEQSYYCLLVGWKRSYDEIGVDIFFDTYFFFEAANSLQTREAE